MDKLKKYIKKPLPIGAIQWNGSNLDEVLDFGEGCATYEAMSSGGGAVVIQTLESNGELKTRHAASIGDFIVRGIKGEYYPIRQAIFEETYEEASTRPAEAERADAIRELTGSMEALRRAINTKPEHDGETYDGINFTSCLFAGAAIEAWDKARQYLLPKPQGE